MPPLADLLSAAATLGTWSLEGFYLPVVLWTILAIAALLLDRHVPVERPLLRRDLLVLLLLALPVGVVGRAVVAPSVPQSMTVALPMPSTFTAIEPTTVEVVHAAHPAPRPWGAIAAGAGLLLLGMLSAGALSAYAVRLLRLRHLARSCGTPASPEIQRLSDQLSLQHTQRPVQLCVSAVAAVPMTLGVRHPIIVLPEPLTRDEQGVRLALLHELAHVRFGDAALAIAVGFLRALGFPHPAVHELVRRVELLGELACDAVVLEAEAGGRRAYGELLVRYSGPSVPLTASLAARPSTLRYRLQALRSRLLLRRAPWRSALASTGVVGLLLATGALQASQHLPSSVLSPAVLQASPQAIGTPPPNGLPRPLPETSEVKQLLEPALAAPLESTPPNPNTAMNRTQRLLTAAALVAATPAAAQTTTPGQSPEVAPASQSVRAVQATPSSQAAPIPRAIAPMEWPAELRRDSIEGRVALNVHVAADGHVIETQPLRFGLRHAGSGTAIAPGSPYEAAVASAAGEAAMRSTFTPAMQGSEPVAAWVMIPMNFQIGNGTVDAAKAACAVPVDVRPGGDPRSALLMHWAAGSGATRPTSTPVTSSDRPWLECLTGRLSESASSSVVRTYRGWAAAALAQLGAQ